MIELSWNERHIIRLLCEGKDDVVLWSCIEGNIGRVWVGNEEHPSYAVVVAADFCFLLGKFENVDYKAIIKVLAEYCMNKIIISEDKSLDSYIESQFPNKFRRFTRYAFNKELTTFDKQQLENFVISVEPKFTVIKINESLYFQALKDGFTADFCSFFASLDEFLKHGIGYAVVSDGGIIAGASSYTYCEGNIEITIGTIESYRRKGLALACASKLILECLERNIYPRWDAANMESVTLAKKLGYHFEKEYEVYNFC